MLIMNDPLREFDRVWRRMTRDGGAYAGMPMQAGRQGDEIKLCFDLPGVDPDDVDLTVDRNILTVTAERKSRLLSSDESIVDEIPKLRCMRQVMLSDVVDTQEIRAEFERGVLVVSIPLSEEARPRRISVSAGRGKQPIEARESEKPPSATPVPAGKQAMVDGADKETAIEREPEAKLKSA